MVLHVKGRRRSANAGEPQRALRRVSYEQPESFEVLLPGLLGRGPTSSGRASGCDTRETMMYDVFSTTVLLLVLDPALVSTDQQPQYTPTPNNPAKHPTHQPTRKLKDTAPTAPETSPG
jgi:hypothetical protein